MQNSFDYSNSFVWHCRYCRYKSAAIYISK